MARIVCFGEAMIRLAPPRNQRIEQARSFDVEIGGAELNCGVGLARLGHTVEWVSAVPNNALGRLVRNRVREAGVDDRHVVVSDEGRCGLNFFEFGATPRPAEVLYDRGWSSVSRVTSTTFDWPGILTGADWFHVTGITPALSRRADKAVIAAIFAAKAAGVKVSFDLNFRSKLWSALEASAPLANLIRGVDLLFACESDTEQLFGITGADFPTVAKGLCDRFRVATVATLHRERVGSPVERLAGLAWTYDGPVESKWYDTQTVDRIGSGDAFAAGLIHGVLGNDLKAGVETGAAFAALKQTIPGDLPLASVAEIEAVIAGGSMRVKR